MWFVFIKISKECADTDIELKLDLLYILSQKLRFIDQQRIFFERAIIAIP